MPKLALASQHLISMFHVFEHLVDPVQTLKLLAQYVHPSGHLFIEVPDATRLCAPHTMFFKAHTLYFTKQSLAQVFAAAGLAIVHTSAPGSENLRVLARPITADARAVPIDRQASWANDGALIASQHQRRWGPYLMAQFSAAAPIKKMRRQLEERKSSRQFASGRDLLTALYVNKQRLL